MVEMRSRTRHRRNAEILWSLSLSLLVFTFTTALSLNFNDIVRVWQVALTVTLCIMGILIPAVFVIMLVQGKDAKEFLNGALRLKIVSYWLAIEIVALVAVSIKEMGDSVWYTNQWVPILFSFLFAVLVFFAGLVRFEDQVE